MSGCVKEIYLGAERAKPMRSVSYVSAIVGKGLEGDRYAQGEGSFSKSAGERDVTLIEMESLWGFYRTTGIDLHPSQTRRNLVTEGVSLSDLVGARFTIGEVTLLGLRPCPPCLHLARMLGIPEILKGLASSGGIYAKVIQGGRIQAGDLICPAGVCELGDRG